MSTAATLPLGLYVHVPFCRRKCPYCDFYSLRALSQREAYVEALLEEMRLRKGEAKGPASTLYLGGGTPSLLSVEAIARIVELARDRYALLSDAEITVELNPEGVDFAYIKGLKSAGVNRVSVGAQRADDASLARLGREHRCEDTRRVVEGLREAGITRVSCDLIYGLPDDGVGEVGRAAETMTGWGCEHISAYTLTVEEGTRFALEQRRGTLSLPSSDAVADIYLALSATLAALGYEHYEVSSYAQAGRRSRHNSLYWDGSPYLGFGPGAHSYDGAKCRGSNPSDLRGYLSALSEGRLPLQVEELDGEALFEEWLLTRLRTREGLDLEEGRRLFGEERVEALVRRASPWLSEGRLVRDSEGRMALNGSAGYLLLDRVVLDLSMVVG